MKFNAKKDISVQIIVYLLTAIIISALVAYAYFFGSYLIVAILFSILAIFIVLFLIMFYGATYEIGEEYLVAKLGFIKIEVNLIDIKEVTEVKNFKFSFATSRNRLEIRFGDTKKKWGKIYISPQNMQDFKDKLELKIERAKQTTY